MTDKVHGQVLGVGTARTFLSQAALHELGATGQTRVMIVQVDDNRVDGMWDEKVEISLAEPEDASD